MDDAQQIGLARLTACIGVNRQEAQSLLECTQNQGIERGRFEMGFKIVGVESIECKVSVDECESQNVYDNEPGCGNHDDTYDFECLACEQIAQRYGVQASSSVVVSNGDYSVSHEISTPGVWGVALGSDTEENSSLVDDFVQELFEQQVDELNDYLRAFGVTEEILAGAAIESWKGDISL